MSEDAHQIALFRFYDFAQTMIPELAFAFHPPNGGVRAKQTAYRLKQMGVRAGVPDVLIPIPRSPYIGLAIEMKYGKNKPTIHQQQYLEMFSSYGWKTAVCYDWTHAAALSCQYFSVDPESFGLHPYEEQK